ncbi:hypothetical protein KEM55_003791 [Ascosphaera atra]|nr:hypothetical protein KEM55_003791 [Ascosphaera atra]
MDTAIPLAYNFPNHDMKMGGRRLLAPMTEQPMALYGNPAATTYSTALQPPSYAFHPLLNQQQAHYQNFFHPVAHPVQRVAPQQAQLPLPAEPPQLQAHRHVPDPRYNKTAVTNLIRTPPPEPVVHHAIHHEVHHEPVPSAPMQTQAEQTPGADAPVLRPEVTFSTEVDTLMKAIQAKSSLSQQEEQQASTFQNIPGANQSWPQAAYNTPPGDANAKRNLASSNSKSRRKYHCTLPGCGKAFYQKTHLDIHMRAHTGDKPFLCKEPGCNQRFSQLGNLKTHQRRHTGEKPFSCDICHKRFAQRGNVRAHKITHERAKPYICRLDDCGKPFTQLGNLKSHQNKFHAPTLRDLTMKFASVTDTQYMTPQDKELWTYFASLYKNSNKGIKGRGKDRRVSTARRSDTSASSSVSTISGDDNQSQSPAYMSNTP